MSIRRIAYTSPVVVLALVAALFAAPQGSQAVKLEPTTATPLLSDTSLNANANYRTGFTFPPGGSNFGGGAVISFVDAAFGLTTATVGDTAGYLVSISTLALLNGGCQTPTSVPFRFYEASIDNSTGNSAGPAGPEDNRLVNYTQDDGDIDNTKTTALDGDHSAATTITVDDSTPFATNDTIFIEEKGGTTPTARTITGVPSGTELDLDSAYTGSDLDIVVDPDTDARAFNGIPDGAEWFPTFLKDIVGGASPAPIARLFGSQKVPGTSLLVTLQLIVYAPGALKDNPGLASSDLLTINHGRPAFTVLNDPTIAASNSSIGDFCTSVSTGTIICGLVDTVPEDPALQAPSCEVPGLVGFNADEKHAESITVNGQIDPGSIESMYRDTGGTGVDAGDTRLSQVGPFLPGSIVAAGDFDDASLIGFNGNEKHEENITTNGLFDPGENGYRDADTSGDVSAGDTRLTTVTDGVSTGVDGVAGSAVISGHADEIAGAGLIGFTATELHAESVLVDGTFNTQISFGSEGENMYRDADTSGDVTTNDVRLNAVGPHAAGSTVGATDFDTGALIAFNANEKHTESVSVNAQFDPDQLSGILTVQGTEKIYRDADTSGTVTSADVRVTQVGSLTTGGFAAGSTVGASDADTTTGAVRSTNPGTAGTYDFRIITISLRDFDNDGWENGLDRCPTSSDGTWSPLVLPFTNTMGGTDDDTDNIPNSCDTTTTSFGTDQDGDLWLNDIDNCPQLANATTGTANVGQNDRDIVSLAVAVPDGGPRSDAIGPECDTVAGAGGNGSTAGPTVPDGHYHYAFKVDRVCLGGATDVDGDGVCNPITDPDDNDTDFDNDGVPDGSDNCIRRANPITSGFPQMSPDINGNGEVQVDDITAVASAVTKKTSESGYRAAYEVGTDNGEIQVDDITAIAGAVTFLC